MRTDMKALISDKLLEMLATKNLDEVTVVDLVTECHISRQTFYYHFHDVMDVIEHLIHSKLDIMVERCLSEPDLESRVRTFVTSYYEFYPLLNRSIKSPRFFHVQKLITEALTAAIGDFKQFLPIHKLLNPDEVDLLFEFLAHGIVGFVLGRTLQSESDVEKLTSQIFKVLHLSPSIE